MSRISAIEDHEQQSLVGGQYAPHQMTSVTTGRTRHTSTPSIGIVASEVFEDSSDELYHQQQRILQEIVQEAAPAEEITKDHRSTDASWRWRLLTLLITLGSGLALGALFGMASWKQSPSHPGSPSGGGYQTHQSTSDQPSLSPSTLPSMSLEYAARIQQVRSVLLSQLTLRDPNHDRQHTLLDTMPKQKAFEWLLLNDHIENADMVFQYYIILIFYYSTNGESWSDQLHFKSSEFGLCMWTTHVIYKHLGVHCDGYDQVTGLNFTGNNLEGAIPTELFLLTSLQFLVLGNNRLSSTIPTTVAQVSQLQSLWLHDNLLSGNLPLELCQLTDLQELLLYDNRLHGNIPNCVGRLTMLRLFKTHRNSFAGTIPTSINQLTRLQQLYVSENDFSGQLPDFSQLTLLEHLTVGNNFRLSGTIPNEWSRLTMLKLLWFDKTKVTGTIPTNLTLSMHHLERFFLHDNPGLQGPLPVFLAPTIQKIHLNNNTLTGNLGSLFSDSHPHLVELDVSFNRITGTIPETLYPTLTDLNVGGNRLTGTVPDLSHMTNLERLIARQNDFSNSSIPTTLGRLTALELLNLRSARLTGTLPSELGLLKQLRVLRLFGNELTGSIPSELKNCRNLKELSLFRNQLTGTLDAGIAAIIPLEDVYLTGNQIQDDFSSTFCTRRDLVDDLEADCDKVVCSCCSCCSISCGEAGENPM